jgi:S-(hydroxymethyl)glutathione dehydrogenase / alcohol dehydrogenase
LQDDLSSLMPGTFQAAVLVQSRAPLEIRELEFPEHLLPGQVLVKVIYSGACASQLHEIDARKGVDPYLPHMLGHEAVGEVVLCGPGVRTKKPGDMVVAHWRKSLGHDAEPARFGSEIGWINAGPVATFSEYAVVSENRLTLLPPTVSLESAPLFGCALTTGFGAVVREARVSPGQSAVVVGFGGVGISILKALQLVSSTPIVVVDVSEEKLTLAESLGADVVILSDGTAGSMESQVQAVLPNGADVVFEVTGNRTAIEEAYTATSASGCTVLVGVPSASDPASFNTLPLHLGKTLVGSHGGSSEPNVDIPRIASLVASGKLSVDDFPTTQFALADVNSALDALRSGILGRVILKP